MCTWRLVLRLGFSLPELETVENGIAIGNTNLQLAKMQLGKLGSMLLEEAWFLCNLHGKNESMKMLSLVSIESLICVCACTMHCNALKQSLRPMKEGRCCDIVQWAQLLFLFSFVRVPRN